MKIEELRLDNYVMYANVTGKVKGIFSDGFLETEMVTAPFTAFQPITLTEEILLKLGAIELVNLTDGYKRFNLDGIHLSISPERDYYIEYVHQIPIKHLNTLQNFYFYTKGKELAVKL